jgi:translation initiation factor eIF-2B subunit beta
MDLDEGDEDDEDEDQDDEDDEDEDDDAEDESSTMSRTATETTTKGKSNKASAQPINTVAHQLKPLLIQAIQELLDELETVDSSVARDARDHIHSG